MVWGENHHTEAWERFSRPWTDRGMQGKRDYTRQGMIRGRWLEEETKMGKGMKPVKGKRIQEPVK